jgi:protein associated with RNAse G/E
MQADFQVESRSYDQMVRGRWRGYSLAAEMRLGDESALEPTSDCIRLWLPAGTPMNWSTATRPLRNNCVQFFWPQRWYTLSAFYAGRELIHTYASIIQPAQIELDRLTYVDLDLSLLVEPDLSYEVLTQAEFEQAADLLSYSEDTRISSLLALQTLTNAIQLGTGLFSLIPHMLNQTDFQRELCQKM